MKRKKELKYTFLIECYRSRREFLSLCCTEKSVDLDFYIPLVLVSYSLFTYSTASLRLLPQNCSGCLNSITRRCDNRMYFARQGSAYQSCFMRQASTEQAFNKSHSISSPGCSGQLGVPLEYSDSKSEGPSKISEAPLFSRPASMKPNIPKFGHFQPQVSDSKLLADPQPPSFARPNRKRTEEMQHSSKEKMLASESRGVGWSPRMEVAEYGSNYVITVKLPAVSAKDIRVEVNDKILAVRSTQFWKVGSSSRGRLSMFHNKEIVQGPNQFVWPLPINANTDSVSAEYLDGYLRITIPKL